MILLTGQTNTKAAWRRGWREGEWERWRYFSTRGVICEANLSHTTICFTRYDYKIMVTNRQFFCWKNSFKYSLTFIYSYLNQKTCICSPSCCSKPVWLCFVDHKKYIFWRMLVTKLFQVPIEFHYILKHTVEINGNRNCLVTNILQNIFFCIPQKKFRLRTAWGWVYEDSVFIFGWTIPFMRHILTQLVRYFTICVLLYNFICFSKTRIE